MIRMVSIFIYSKMFLLKKDIFDESKLFSNATLIWAIKCKVGDFAQELVGTRSLSLSKASSPSHSLHHSNPTICNTRWYEVEIDHISCLNSCLRSHCITHRKGSWGRWKRCVKENVTWTRTSLAFPNYRFFWKFVQAVESVHWTRCCSNSSNQKFSSEYQFHLIKTDFCCNGYFSPKYIFTKLAFN